MTIHYKPDENGNYTDAQMLDHLLHSECGECSAIYSRMKALLPENEALRHDIERHIANHSADLSVDIPPALALSYELDGVIIDTEQGHGFDAICLATIKRVRDALRRSALGESSTGTKT